MADPEGPRPRELAWNHPAREGVEPPMKGPGRPRTTGGHNRAQYLSQTGKGQSRRSWEATTARITPEMAADVCRWIKMGHSLRDASILSGLDPGTAPRWVAWGAEAALLAERAGRAVPVKSAPYVAFRNAVVKAMVEADAADLALIQLAAKKDWRAAAWRLQVRNPDRYGSVNGGSVSVGHQERRLPDGTVESQTVMVMQQGTPGASDPLLTDDDWTAAARVLIERKRARQAAGESPKVIEHKEDP